jgi:prophage regulatory protein
MALVFCLASSLINRNGGVMQESNRFLRIKEVMQKVGLSRSQVYRLIQAGMFPSPFKIGSRVSVWSESLVSEWMSGIEGRIK